MNVVDVRGDYKLSFDNQEYELNLNGELEKLEAKISKDSLNYGTKVTYNEPWLSLVIKTKDTVQNNYYRLSGTFSKDVLEGKAVLENGKETFWKATKQITEEKKIG